MLRKLPEIDVPIDEPFRYDALNRYSLATNLTSLLKSVSDPFVLSINSPWGGGKTTFIKMWRQYLINNNMLCLYFNAWETDFSENSLLSFISEISEYFGQYKIKGKSKDTKEFTDKCKAILIAAIPLIIKYGTYFILDLPQLKESLISLSEPAIHEIGKDLSKLAIKKLQYYEAQKNAINQFRQNIAEIISILVNKSQKEVPLIIFVDELDRCRPSYALELLENIKHLFSIPNVVFVLSIDRNQLNHMVKSLYGIGMDSNSYLRRFIDLDFSLPDPDKKSYSEYIFQKFKFQDFFSYRQSGFSELAESLRIFITLSELFDYSLRTIAQCASKLNIVLRITPPNYPLHINYLIFLIFLKMEYPKIYFNLNQKLVSFEELYNLIVSLKNGDKFIDSDGWVEIEGYILLHLMSDATITDVEANLKNCDGMAVESKKEKVLNNIENLIHNQDEYEYNIQKYLINKLELSDLFKK